MKLHGAHLILRPPVLADAQEILAWENAPEVAVLSSHDGNLSLSDIQDYISGITDVYLDKQLRWVIMRDDQAIGTMDIFDLDFDAKKANVGILIADVRQRRLGAGKEAMELAIKYCKEVLKLRTLIADVQTHNKASISFFEQLGFIEIQKAEAVIRYEYDINF